MLDLEGAAEAACKLKLAPRLLVGLVMVCVAAHGADIVYVNGSVVTMDGKGTVAEAVAVTGGRIERVGSAAELRKLGGKVVDLQGRTMLPGFYAAHDHFPQIGIMTVTQVDLNSPPIGTVGSMEHILRLLKQKAASTPKGQWIVGRGYDDTLIRDKRHPTKLDLDQVSTEHPVWVTHISGHMGAGNTMALQIAKVTKDTPQPKGGHVAKDSKTGEPTGYIEESHSMVTRHIPAVTPEQMREGIRWANREYLSKGVTTASVTGGARERYIAVRDAIARGDVKLRFDWYLSGANIEKLPGNDRIRINGVKAWHDGSIQGYTGYLGAPYHVQPAGKNDYRGYPTRTRDELVNMVARWHKAGMQAAIHANGDAAIDDVLFAYEKVLGGKTDARFRIEHCQTPREEQLDAMKRLGITPSFFVGHVYYWGDRHRDIFLGPTRAARISPLKSALNRGIRFSIHNDTPVTPVDPLLLVWNAVNRTTRDGQVLGAEQRIGVMQALRAVTSDAAWQNFDENTRGSIEEGKAADFVVLDRNPLNVPPMEIRNIAVTETIVGGEPVWKKGR